MDALNKKELSAPGTDRAGTFFTFWVKKKSEIKRQLGSYDTAIMEFHVETPSHKSLITCFKKIGIAFDFNKCNYTAIFLGQVELYHELLKCFEMQLTPKCIESGENLEELKNDLIKTIETVWIKCCRDSKMGKGLDEKTYTSFKTCCGLVETLAQKSAATRSAEPAMISEPSGAPFVLHLERCRFHISARPPLATRVATASSPTRLLPVEARGSRSLTPG